MFSSEPLFFPWCIRLVDDTCFAARMKEIHASLGAEQLSTTTLLALTFLAEGYGGEPETVATWYARAR